VTWGPIEGADSVEFTPTDAERGMRLRCAVTAVSRDGWRSPVLLCGTEGSVAAPPLAIVCTGPPVTGAPLAVNQRGRVLWQRLETGGWVDIAVGAQFVPSAAEVGVRVRAVAKECTTEPTKPVELAPAVRPHVAAAMKMREFCFRAVGGAGALWAVTCRRADIEMRSNQGAVRSAKWASVSCDCGNEGEIMLTIDAGSRFPLSVSLAEDHPRAEALMGAANVRDFVAAVIRGFAARALAGGTREVE
jgi:hypothetical protein